MVPKGWVLMGLIVFLLGCSSPGGEGAAPQAAVASPVPAATFPPTWTPAPTHTPAPTRTPRPTEERATDGEVQLAEPSQESYSLPLGGRLLEVGRRQEGEIRAHEHHLYHYTHQGNDPILWLLTPEEEVDVQLEIYEGHLTTQSVSDAFSATHLDGGWDGEPEGMLFRAAPGFDYTLVVETIFDGAGTYTLESQRVNNGMPGLLWQDSDSVSGAEVTEHRVRLESGRALTLYLLPEVNGSTIVNLHLEIVDPAGQSLGEWDEGTFNGMEQVPLTPAVSGEYLIRVRESFEDNANYTLLLFEDS